MTPTSALTTIESASSESFNCVALNRQGSLIAAGGTSKTVCLWDLADRSTPRQLAAIAGHSDAILNVKFDRTGRYLASADSNGCVGLVTLKEHSIQLYKAHNKKAYSVAFSPDGSLIASGGADGIARVAKVNSFYENQSLIKHTYGICRQVLFSPSGQQLIIAGGSGCSIVDIAKGNVTAHYYLELNTYNHSVALKNDSILYLANNFNRRTTVSFLTYIPVLFTGAVFIGGYYSNDNKAANEANIRFANYLEYLSEDLPPPSFYSSYYLEGEFSLRDTSQPLLASSFGKFPEAFRSEVILDDNTLIHSYLTPQSQVNGCMVHKIAFWDVRTQSLVKSMESNNHSSIGLPIALANGLLACAGGNRITLRDIQETREPSPTPSVASAAIITNPTVSLPEIPNSDLTYEKKLYTGVGTKVFQALWNRERVAVKRCDYKNEQEKTLLLNEANKLAQIRHERIVQFKAVVYYPNSRLGIVMEFLPRSLHDINQEERELAWGDRLRIAQDIVKAVEFLHACIPPVVHRDIKSLNVMVSQERRAKLTDFGLSRIIETMSSSLLTSKPTTYNWSAPENLDGFYSPASDMWSTAMTLYEIASRQIPYYEVEISHHVGKKIERAEVPEFPTNTPKAFVNAAMSCLVKEPDRRSSATQLLNLLDKVTV